MTTAETHNPAEYKALLRADFASFARHSFHELNSRTPFALGWHFEGHRCEIGSGARGAGSGG